MDRRHEHAEERAIERHRKRLMREWSRDVELEEAREHWLCHCAVEWRRKRQEVMLAHQREEMLRYKWIESEKAQRDVGKEVFMEWIARYAAKWRTWYDEHEEEIIQQHQLD